MGDLKILRQSLMRRIQARQGRHGVAALRHRLRAVTHAIMEMENR